MLLSSIEGGLHAGGGVDSEALLRQLDLHVAHPRLAIAPQLARELGVRSVDASFLSEALQHLITGYWLLVTDY